MNKIITGFIVAFGGACLMILKRQIATELLGGSAEVRRILWNQDMYALSNMSNYVQIGGVALLLIGVVILVIGITKISGKSTGS